MLCVYILIHAYNLLTGYFELAGLDFQIGDLFSFHHWCHIILTFFHFSSTGSLFSVIHFLSANISSICYFILFSPFFSIFSVLNIKKQRQQPQPTPQHWTDGGMCVFQIIKYESFVRLKNEQKNVLKAVSFSGHGNNIVVGARNEPISLSTLDRDCFIIPVHSLDRFLPAGIPVSGFVLVSLFRVANSSLLCAYFSHYLHFQTLNAVRKKKS